MDSKPQAGRKKLKYVQVLVAHERLSWCVFAHVIPQKGIDIIHFTVDIFVEDIKWLGYTRIVLKSDNEPGIVKLLRSALTGARHTVVELEQINEEHSNKYDCSSNASAEQALKVVTGILRTNKIDFENKWDMTLPLEHPVFSWLVEYSALVRNVVKVGDDNTTAYQPVRGQAPSKRFICFGEKVPVHLHTKGPAAQHRGKLAPRWQYGFMLGYGTASHAYWVYSLGTVQFVRSIKRLPDDQQWAKAGLQEVSETRQSLHQLRAARAAPFGPQGLQDRPDEESVRRRRAARNFEIRLRDLDPTMSGIWWTEGCPSCDRARRYGLEAIGAVSVWQTAC